MVLLKNEDSTRRFASEFAKELNKGDVIELIGDLGSGKTFFARALSEALGSKGASSPSFVIKNEYTGGKFPVQHFDFYRLDDPGVIADELSESLSSGENLIIVEWGRNVRNILPDERYQIYFKVAGNDSRELTISR